MEKIRTLQIDIETGWRGGQRQVELLCRGLTRLGHPTALLTRPGSSLGAKLSDQGIEVFEIPVAFEFDPIAVTRTARIIRRFSPDIVGMHASHSHSLGILAARLANPKPALVVTRRVDFVPGKDPFNRWKYGSGPDAYIAISQAIRKVLTDWGLPFNKVELVHSGVPQMQIPNDARNKLPAELDAGQDSILIGNAAGLVDHKGHQYLLNAIPMVLEKFPNALFLIAGDGELKSELHNLAATLGLSEKNLRFLGYRKDVELLYGAIDLFVMTSHLEGLCTSIIDAQLARVPVVATEAGGIPELVVHETTGLLAENRSAKSIAENILRALSDPNLCETLVEKAHQQAEKRFTDEAMVNGTLAAYRKILGLDSL